MSADYCLTAAREQREMQRVEVDRPILSAVYDASSWSYSLVGAVFLGSLRALPRRGQPLPGVPGRLYGVCLVLQGAISYCNDVHVMRGRSPKPSPAFGQAVVWGDRFLAASNFGFALCCARTWPLAGGAAELLLRSSLVGSCCLTFSSSVQSLENERYEDYMLWHSAWHIVPTTFALVWIALHRGRVAALPRWRS